MPDEFPATPLAPAEALGVDGNSGSVRGPAPSHYFWLSAWIPGAGQVAQRRFGTAAIQAATVVTYLVVAAGSVDESGRALLLALAWYVWSAIDAFWHARDV